MIELFAALGIILAISGLVFWASRKGGEGERAKTEKQRGDAYEREIDRIGKASTARHDAERAARGGMLDDEHTRD